jgi:hypothetical protein
MRSDSLSSRPVARLKTAIACKIGSGAGGEQGSVKVEPGEGTQEQQAPEGPPVSSRRFQPADNIAMRITPTPTGLTGSPAPPGPIRFFCLVSVGCTHGYSRFAPSGQFPPRHFVLIRDFDGTLRCWATAIDPLRGMSYTEFLTGYAKHTSRNSGFRCGSGQGILRHV